MKTHYELLGVDPTADGETIKKAFRKEIARYHPDKVTHLGVEFQQMAATRTSELTTAYKTLTDPDARAEYDASLRGGLESPPLAPPTAADVSERRAAAEPARETPPPGRSFDRERVGRDEILRGATLSRLRGALEHLLSPCDLPDVTGFDLACIPRGEPARTLKFSRGPKTMAPTVFVRLAPVIDGDVATDAWRHALRARLVEKDRPTLLLLVGSELAPVAELSRAIEAARLKSPNSQDKMFPVPVDLRDWSVRFPLNTPDAVRTLVERLRSSV